MTRLAALALTLAVAPLVAAQEGVATYSVTTQIEIELPPELAHMADQIPSEQTVEKQLLFTSTETLTRDAPKDDDDEGGLMPPPSTSGVTFRFSGGRDADERTHVDLETGTVTETRDFLGRDFRIVGERAPLAWRLTGEQGSFLGYAAMQAVATRDSTTVEAWFTSEIPVSAGPESYGGLPGLILVLTDGRRTFEATDVTLGLAEAIEVPTKGREVTRDAFEQIVEEKMEELEASRPRGGRGGILIRRN